MTKIELTKQLKNKEEKILSLNAKVFLLEERLKELTRSKFGKSREKIIYDEAELLEWDDSFGDTLSAQVEVEQEATKRRASTPRKKQKYGKFLDGLPVKKVTIDLSEPEKIGLVPAGEDVSRRLAYTPASYYVIETTTLKYVSQKHPEFGFITGQKFKPAVPGSLFSESFYANLLIRKFADHLPLYRLEEIFKRDGLNLSRQTMSLAVFKLADLLSPIHQGIRQAILVSKNCHVDETTVKELSKGKCKTGYFWALVGSHFDSEMNLSQPMVYYDYHDNRRHENALELLGEDYQGVFHSDAYQAYSKLTSDGLIWQPCWAHARREFFNALSAMPVRLEVIKLMDKAFRKEREYWKLAKESDFDANELKIFLLKFRQEECKPIIEEIFETVKNFLETGHYFQGEKILKACNYLLGRKASFMNFLNHPEARMDNNLCERSIRPLTIGRKNWMFVGSPRGGKSTAIISSIIQTCRNLYINPEAYLNDILKRINNTSEEDIETLLPHNWQK